ncbi:hypothetical protein GSI_15613 [Ganoderma sinense ZZ0214-1]|uniref:Uncharacterized protein n=1 Tax=Ganoderma sinense ZZ0214-1 TaxID=1077348 RepID=A0A2G8RN27_9APHY|nr:hypothetical protein GSI_15613 [Ganoderma sinense ZZ0214-1]
MSGNKSFQGWESTQALQLDAVTVELRKGPDLLSGPSPALSYPQLPPDDEVLDGEHYYALGWPMDDVTSTRLMEVADCEVKHRDQSGYKETLVEAKLYASGQMNYFHMWTTYVPDDENDESATGGRTELATDGDDSDAGYVQVCVICCSAPDAYCRRMSEAGFQWLKKVMGKEPRWYLVDRVDYDSVRREVWRVTWCCPSGHGLTHLVDLETGTWKDGRTIRTGEE